MTTIYSIDANRQERYDSVRPEMVGKTINILKRKGQLKIRVIKIDMKKRTVTELQKDESLLREQLEEIGSSSMDLVDELIEVSILLEQESNK